MKKKHSVYWFATAVILLLTTVLPVFAQSFGIIGSVLTTDIKAYINGAQIPAYNVNGNMVIVGSDLRCYGFNVVYDNNARTSSVTYNGNGKWEPIAVSSQGTDSIGEKVMDVYDTDISVIINGKKVDSYNVDGKMAFRFSELKVYGEYYYDNTSRTTNLKIGTAETKPAAGSSTADKTVSQDIPNKNLTLGEKNALASAKSYLALMPFSYSGMIDQLEFEGYTTAEATYAADSCGADWYVQAELKAKDYLDLMPFSRPDLVEQLMYEGYTADQAEKAVQKCGADWYVQAELKAKDYLDLMPFSRSGLVEQLVYEGYTADQAEKAVQKCGADWKKQAALKAQDYLDLMSFSRSSLIEQLMYEGFTAEEAEYAVKAVGY